MYYAWILSYIYKLGNLIFLSFRTMLILIIILIKNIKRCSPGSISLYSTVKGVIIRIIKFHIVSQGKR